eukprot:727423_1
MICVRSDVNLDRKILKLQIFVGLGWLTSSFEVVSSPISCILWRCHLRICQFSVLFWTEKGWHRKWRAFKTRSRLSEFMHSKLDRDLIYSSEMHGLRPNMCHDKAISNIGYKIDKNKANIDIQKYINLVHNGPLVSFV